MLSYVRGCSPVKAWCYFITFAYLGDNIALTAVGGEKTTVSPTQRILDVATNP
ncbi:MAG: hypothetical protein WBW16_13420 [Bacteroidota bacterium]